MTDPIEQSAIEGASRAFRKAAERARVRAATMTDEIENHAGTLKRQPEAVLAESNAAMWDACADDVEAGK
jgi:hypothetical protein